MGGSAIIPVLKSPFWENGLEIELRTRLLPQKAAGGSCYSLILHLYYEVVLLLLDLKSVLVFFS